MNVKSNIGKDFLTLIDKAFPPDNSLSGLFNRHTVKLSYKRMPNMAQAVAGYNSKILSEERETEQELECKHAQGKCQATGVVYQASVKEIPTGNTETYTWATARRFKDRLYEHRTDMNSEKGRKKPH